MLSWLRKKPKKNWLVLEHYNDEVHIIPLNDDIYHVPSDCPCGPRTEPEKRKDGSIGWVVSHNSLDGREALERAKE